MGDKADSSPKPSKNVRLELGPSFADPGITVEPSHSPLRQSLQLNNDSNSPSKSFSTLKQSFYRGLTPKSSSHSPLLLSSASYRSPVKSINKKKSALRCESLEVGCCRFFFCIYPLMVGKFKRFKTEKWQFVSFTLTDFFFLLT
jgi:hypothetical protein